MKNCIFVKEFNRKINKVSKRYYYPIEILNIQKVQNTNIKFLIDVELNTTVTYPPWFIKKYAFYSETSRILFNTDFNNFICYKNKYYRTPSDLNKLILILDNEHLIKTIDNL